MIYTAKLGDCISPIPPIKREQSKQAIGSSTFGRVMKSSYSSRSWSNSTVNSFFLAGTPECWLRNSYQEVTIKNSSKLQTTAGSNNSLIQCF